MHNPEIAPLDGSKDPRVCVPLGMVKKACPENAGELFDELFDAAERKFGAYPQFQFMTEENLLCAKPREVGPEDISQDDSQGRPPSEVISSEQS